MPDSQGSEAMRTSEELRIQAKDCLQLANGTDEYYAKVTLQELAHSLHREARQAERRERDMAALPKVQTH
jgi:hypothetical protein